MNEDENKALEFLFKLIKDARDKGLVCTLDPRNCEMPSCWDSDEGGMAFTWKNAVIVCHRNPRSMRESISGAKPSKCRGWKIKCAISCHYLKGQNPKAPGDGCSMPFLVVSQMVNDKGQSFIKKFSPNGITDGDVQDSILPEEEAFKVLMSELIMNDDEMPVKIDGGISAASIMASGKDFSKAARKNENGSGCLSMILLFVGVAVYCLT